MARTMLTALDLRGNELRNARVQNLAGAPANPVAGQLYFNSALAEMFFFNGTEWVSAKASGPAGGDLTGTYPNPTIAAGVIDNANIAANAAIDLSKLAVDVLAEIADGDDAVRGEFAAADTDLRTDLEAAIADAATANGAEAADIRADFAAADTAIRDDFAAADTAVRAAFAAADTAMMGQIQQAFQDAQDAATADHASIRADFAAADVQVRTDFAAADNGVRADFAAADAVVTAAFGEADAAVRTDFTAADTALRADMNAADVDIRADFAAADTALDATLRTYVDNMISSSEAQTGADIADLRSDVEAADTQLRTDFGAADTALRDLLRGEFAAADTAVRGEFAAADTALRTQLRGEFAAADTALDTALRAYVDQQVTNADSATEADLTTERDARIAADTAIRAEFAAADTALQTSLTNSQNALAATLRAETAAGDTTIRGEFAAADTAVQAFAIQRANHTGTQPVATLSDFDTAVRAVPLSDMAAPDADVTLAGRRIVNLATPVDDGDAATKGYVDAVNQGLDPKASVRAASTGNVTRSGLQTLDGVDLVAGDRVLLKDQTDASQNGIYTVSGGAWQRSADANDGDEVNPGMFTFVEEGLAYGDSGWVLATDGDVTLGTTALTFVQFSGAGQVTAGSGLTKDGNVLNVGGTANRIDVLGDSVDISNDYVGQASITTVGTLTSGALGAGFTTVAVEQGGTGATTPAAARQMLGAVTKVAFTLNSSATEYNLVHGLNSRDIMVQVRENSAPFGVVEADVEINDLNGLTVRFAEAPAANAYRVTVMG